MERGTSRVPTCLSVNGFESVGPELIDRVRFEDEDESSRGVRVHIHGITVVNDPTQ